MSSEPNRLGAFAVKIRAATIKQNMGIRSEASDFASTYDASSGGYAVPVDYVNDIFMRSEDALLPFCNVVPVSSGRVEIPIDGTAPWEEDGIRCEWLEEAVPAGSSKPDLSLQQFNLKKLLALVPATDELVEDSAALGAWLPQALSRAATWKANNAILNGTGAGVPMGIQNADSLIVVDKESAQAAGTIVEANVGNMLSRCLDVFGARWICNPDALAQIIKLDSWYAPNRTLAGLPVTLTEAASAIGAKGDITLANLSGYRVVSRGEKLANSSHLYFDQSVTAYRLTTRLDGGPILAAPTLPPNSSNTRSHFVTLQART